MSPRVSVLLTSYNRPVMLAEAAGSVLAQTFTDFELIILDDNSSDPGVAELLAGYWNHPQISIYKSSVQPGERALLVRYAVLANVGLRLARGEYITYLCDDDWYLPQRLQVMTARLDEGGCQVVYGAQQMVRDGALCGIRGTQGVLTSPACVVDHSSVMHTRRAGLDAGGWDENPVHWTQGDAAFWTRLVEAGHLFHPIADVLDAHRYHPAAVGAVGGPY